MMFSISKNPHLSIIFSTLILVSNILIIKAQITPLQINVPSSISTKPYLPERGVESNVAKRREGFVQTQDGHFYLGDQLFDFRGFKSVNHSEECISIRINTEILTFILTLA